MLTFDCVTSETHYQQNILLSKVHQAHMGATVFYPIMNTTLNHNCLAFRTSFVLA